MWAMVIYFILCLKMFEEKKLPIQRSTQCTGNPSPVYLVYLQFLQYNLHGFSYLLKKTVSVPRKGSIPDSCTSLGLGHNYISHV